MLESSLKLTYLCLKARVGVKAKCVSGVVMIPKAKEKNVLGAVTNPRAVKLRILARPKAKEGRELKVLLQKVKRKAKAAVLRKDRASVLRNHPHLWPVSHLGSQRVDLVNVE